MSGRVKRFLMTLRNDIPAACLRLGSSDTFRKITIPLNNAELDWTRSTDIACFPVIQSVFLAFQIDPFCCQLSDSSANKVILFSSPSPRYFLKRRLHKNLRNCKECIHFGEGFHTIILEKLVAAATKQASKLFTNVGLPTEIVNGR